DLPDAGGAGAVGIRRVRGRRGLSPLRGHVHAHQCGVGPRNEDKMEQSWKQAKAVFAAASAPPVAWLLFFFLIPMAVIWAYSFGENSGPITIDVNGTLANYGRALDPLYLNIFVKSLIIAALTTLLCLMIGFPVALGIAFSSPKAKAWLLLLIMLPFWTNLL